MRYKLAFLLSILLLASCSSKNKLSGSRTEVVLSTNSVEIVGPRRDIVMDRAQVWNEWNQFGRTAGNIPGNLKFTTNPKMVFDLPIKQSSINGNCVTASPLFIENNIIFVDAGGVLHSLDPKTKSYNWSFSTTIKNEIGQSGVGLAYSNGVIVVSTSFSECFGISLSGKLLWRRALPAPCKGDAISISNGYAYLACSNNSVHKIDIKTGRTIWSSSGVDSNNSFLGMAAPVVQNGYVLAAYSSGELSCIRDSDGVELWEVIVSKYSPTDASTTIQHLRISPIIENGVVYVISSNGLTEAFEIVTGTRLWSIDVGGLSQVTMSKSHLYVIDRLGVLYCIDKSDGSVAWAKSIALPEKNSFWRLDNFKKGFKRKVYTYYPWYAQFLVGNHLLIVMPSGKLVYINPVNGQVKKIINFEHPVSVPPIIVNETMYILCDDGYILSLR